MFSEAETRQKSTKILGFHMLVSIYFVKDSRLSMLCFPQNSKEGIQGGATKKTIEAILNYKTKI